MTINCVKQEKHTLKVYGAKKEMIYLYDTSKTSVSRQTVFIESFPNTVGSAPF